MGRRPAIVAGRQGAEAANVAKRSKITLSISIPHLVRNTQDSKNNYCYIRDRPDSDKNISIAKVKIKQQDLDRNIFNLPYTRKFTFFLKLPLHLATYCLKL